ncbi:MAG: hypothetical protein QM755_10115 [Luteolibacter sp.]
MKPKFIACLTAVSLCSCLSSQAASLTWNSSVAGGTWDTTTSTNWLDGASAATWNNTTPDSAIFGATGVGTVTLGAAITANSVTANTAGYTITGNTLTLGGASPTVTTNADIAISSVLAGNSGFTKAGTGKLALSAQSTMTGTLSVTGGTLNFPTAYGNGSSSIKVSAINLGPGTTMTLASLAFGWYANNASGLTVNLDEGATMESTGSFGMAFVLKGATITNTNSSRLDLGGYGTFAASVSTLASANSSILKPGGAGVYLRPDSGQSSYTFNVADGAAAVTWMSKAPSPPMARPGSSRRAPD